MKNMIERTFQNIPDGKLAEADQQSFLINLGWSRGMTWDDLLCSQRVMIISEAGAGKTHECKAQAQRLWDKGEPSFYVDLTSLAIEDLRHLLDDNEETRLDVWLSSQSEFATFFLDSIDELKLSQGSFELALKRLKKCIKNQLARVRIVITTRPIPFDEQLVRQLLPVPPTPSSESSEEAFVKIAMRDHRQQRENKDKDEVPEWRTVALMPLSDKQIIEFSRDQGINDPGQLLEDLQRRNAQDFARRPQDLIELCADWREHRRIRTHRDQVETNVRVKLLPREDRQEPAELSLDKAIEGAGRLALAMQLTRRLTIRHNAESDVAESEAALDPTTILSDWQPNERKALLERPLFGFASYGRVRFHHRSVAEFLAAERLLTLRERGMPFRALKRVIFAETKGKTIVRPSKRPVAGWLALKDQGIFELLRDNEPAVLFNEGDPESLTNTQRSQTLCAYTDRYGQGGWRGLHVPYIQVRRFASRELASEISQIWQKGIENPEVRQVVINLIEMGRIDACADIAAGLAQNAEASPEERIIALDALIALEDEKLGGIAVSIASSDAQWPDRVAHRAVLRLFPKYISVAQLCNTLRRMKIKERSVGGIGWQLSRLIEQADLAPPVLGELRDGLATLMSEGLRWQEDWPHAISNRAYLRGALAATCVRGLEYNQSEHWLHASVLALRVHDENYDDEPIKSLQARLGNLNAEANARLFWTMDALLQHLYNTKNPWNRYCHITSGGLVQLKSDRDMGWICDALGNTARDKDDRALLLEIAVLLPSDHETRKEHFKKLKPLVIDQPSFVTKIDNMLIASQDKTKYRSWEKEEVERKKKEERRQEEARASWIKFWREVANQPEVVFSSERCFATAWYLWHAMQHDGDNSRSSGWNRHFIENHFGKETADRLRRVLMAIWRNDSPTFPSERPEEERNTFLTRWQLGFAAIYAEAEDPNWTKNLTGEEAQLAARYSPVGLGNLPQWVEDLVDAHPNAVNQTLGNELSWELDQPPEDNGHSFLLQRINYAPTKVAILFLPRLKAWLDANGDQVDGSNNATRMARRVSQVTRVIFKHGDDVAITHLLKTTRCRLENVLPLELRKVWLPSLMRMDPASGVAALEVEVAGVEPAERSEAVTWFANLFGDRWSSINLNAGGLTPQLLLRLLRLAYRHVRNKDDTQHEGPYTPTIRDDAEFARNAIVSALLNAKGEEGWTAKLEMAADPLCEHFKDRVLAEAEENWAQEVDTDALDEKQAAKLERSYEAPAVTNQAMFTTVSDRLADLNDLLLRDDSPRETWAEITKEYIMRREIARELNHAANSIYTVDQEAVTADEKETDIRLRSTASAHEAVIELKLGDGRTAKDLGDTIENQLVKKYMAPENRKSGFLLITLAKDREWKHPVENRRIDADELFSLLREEAMRIQNLLGGNAAIGVHFLDLRPRLPRENEPKLK